MKERELSWGEILYVIIGLTAVVNVIRNFGFIAGIFAFFFMGFCLQVFMSFKFWRAVMKEADEKEPATTSREKETIPEELNLKEAEQDRLIDNYLSGK